MPQTDIGTSERLLEELRGWVELETPTTDAPSLNRLIDVAEAELGKAGAALTRIPGRDGFGDILVARTPGEGPPIVMAGHLDTVWGLGTLKTMPFRVEGDQAHGPGIYDMKAGSFLAMHAVREILRQKVPTKRPITLLLTPDEEVGSPTSRAVIEAEAKGATAVLILEPAGLGGAAVTARKGVGRFTVRIRGRAAHSGGSFIDGRSAIVEAAHQVLAIAAMVNLKEGITTNVAPIHGGTRPNVIAQEAEFQVDLRVRDAADGARIEKALLGLKPVTPDVTVSVTGGMNRPPFAESPAILALYERYRAICAKLGFEVPKQHRGGGSDGNFTAALGIPTLDGLGCPGGGAHADDEHILWRELAPRGAALAEMLETLE